MRRMSRGFTIIELLVVISVIGILSTISFTGFNRYQADARDSQRQSQATAITEALEKYYDRNGEYPACPAITAAASSVTTTTLPGLDPKVLVTPQDPTVESNSIKCQNLTSSSDPDIFGYIGDGSAVCSTGNSCLAFTLKYKQDVTGTITSINSRRQATLASSGAITDLSATTFSFDKVNLNWTAVSGATSYNIQYSTDQSHWTSFTAATTNSAQVTGLTLGTPYFFQVQPATATTSGTWSNTASATTFTLNTPTGVATDDATTPVSVLDFDWAPAPANATSYSVQYASNTCTAPFTTFTVGPPGSITHTTVTGLTAGSTLCFQVKAIAAGYTSGWSAPATATTTVPVPTGLTATTNSSTQITANWNTVSVSGVSYTLDYSTDSNFASPAPTTTLTSTSGKITGIAQSGTPSKIVTGLQQGTTIYFRVYAVVNVASSLASTSANATTTVDTPGAPGIQGITPETVRSSSAGNWFPGTLFQSGAGNYYFSYGQITSASCPAGAYAVYTFSATYSAKPSGAPQSYSQGPTTDTVWYVERPNSGYTVAFYANYYCQGPNAASGYSGTSGASAGH